MVSQGSEWFFGFVLQIPDRNTIISSSSNPLVRWVEFDVIDVRFGLEF
jgi:hypothetical protein